MRNRIVVIHSTHPNDTESFALVRDAFAAFGYVCENYAVGQPDFAPRFSELLSFHANEIFCFVSWNYTAAPVIIGTQRLHTATGIPMVIWLFDHPIYSRPAHVPELADTIVFVQGEDAADFVAKNFGGTTTPIVQTGPFPQHYDHPAPDYEQFIGRRNEIICPMNLGMWGRGLDEAWQKIRALPKTDRAYVNALLDDMMFDLDRPFHARAAQLAEGSGLDPAAALLDAESAITFLKLWRRDRMVRALIDLPILISSESVPPDLELRYPKKFTLLSMQDTLPLYSAYRFVFNTYPVITHTFHDRILQALYANAICITDANLITKQYFTGGRDMVFFDYEHPEKTAAEIAGLIDNPQAAFEMTVSAYATAKANKPLFFDSYQRLIDAVGAHWNPPAA